MTPKLPKRNASLEASARADEDEGLILDLDTRFDLSAFGSERGDEAAPAAPPAKEAQPPLAAFPPVISPARAERTRGHGPPWPPTPLSQTASGPELPISAAPAGPPSVAVPQVEASPPPIPQPPLADRGIAASLVVPPPAPEIEESTGSPPPRHPATPMTGGALASHPGILREAPSEAPLPVIVDTSRRRWHTLATAALLLVAVLVAAGLWTGRSTTALLAPSATGELTVESTPAGASVIIEGQDRGRTPVSLRLPPGNYDVELRSGRQRHVVAARVGGGATTAQHVVLRADGPSRGQLRVTSDPPSATVTVDGRHRGRTPLLVTDLAAGRHEVVVTGPGGPVKERVQVEADTTTLLALPLPRKARTPAPAAVNGWLSVRSPVDLKVYEGERLLGTSSVDRLKLTNGAHTLRFVNEAAEVNVSRPVRIEPGKTTRVEVAVPTGLLSINAAPWATVSVDGREVGETPLGNLEFPAGQHEVIFRHPEFGERRQRITLRAGITSRVSVDMRR